MFSIANDSSAIASYCHYTWYSVFWNLPLCPYKRYLKPWCDKNQRQGYWDGARKKVVYNQKNRCISTVSPVFEHKHHKLQPNIPSRKILLAHRMMYKLHKSCWSTTPICYHQVFTLPSKGNTWCDYPWNTPPPPQKKAKTVHTTLLSSLFLIWIMYHPSKIRRSRELW
jgi:hypothetical protein